jgi:hypothetical protein
MPTNFSQIVQARLLFTKEPPMHHQHFAPYHVRQRQPTRVCVCVCVCVSVCVCARLRSHVRFGMRLHVEVSVHMHIHARMRACPVHVRVHTDIRHTRWHATDMCKHPCTHAK